MNTQLKTANTQLTLLPRVNTQFNKKLMCFSDTLVQEPNHLK